MESCFRPNFTMLLAACLLVIVSPSQAQPLTGVDESKELYQINCAVCHGDNLEGAALGVPLRGELRHGDDMASITSSIREGIADTEMPEWGNVLSENQVRNVALFVLESRVNLSYDDVNINKPLQIPTRIIETELHDFTLETIVTDLHDQVYSIAPMPDGSILVTEKMHGLRVISPNGEISELIAGTPETSDEFFVNELDQQHGQGWVLDVKPHPDYSNNGWIYLSLTERCEDDCERGVVSMAKLLRGRIRDGQWVDQETIWEVDKEFYVNRGTDLMVGARITFDDNGHVFLSVGAMGGSLHAGIQNLDLPYGKIHRINDDGSVPDDNPAAGQDGIYPTLWSYGHRSPHGLEFDSRTGRLWETENGPRGGDEINLVLPGRNYGWPLTSLGMNYDGTPIDGGPALGIAWEMADIELPVVDLTPSPAVSSFIISRSSQFPQWENQFLVGSLKASSLYRIEIDDNGNFVQRETLLSALARIRDIEQGENESIYLLLEHTAGSHIVRLVPADN